MSSGLRIRNSSGGIVLDVIDRVSRFHAAFSYNIAAFGSTDIHIPGYTTDGTWFFFLLANQPQVSAVNIVGGIRLSNVFNTAAAGTLHVLRA